MEVGLGSLLTGDFVELEGEIPTQDVHAVGGASLPVPTPCLKSMAIWVISLGEMGESTGPTCTMRPALRPWSQV